MKHLIPEAALKKHIAILGMNGSGKTSVAKSQIIEPALAAGERVCNVDPTGVGWGLRLSATGKSKGYPIYIVGGDHADFPLFRRDGKAWAEIVGTSSDSFVFDTSAMTVEDRSQWFTDFAETLVRKNKGPLKLVLDEAHLFAPQGGSKSGGVAPRMLHATNNLLALGRSRGLRITMISQRPAKLHKDSLTQAHTLIAMALMAPQDRNAVKDWIADQADAERGKEIIASLPSLAPGEAWIWAPKEKVLDRVKFSRPTTFDSSSAPDDADATAVELSPVDPAAIKAKLATVAKETVANDPVALKAALAARDREIVDLKRAATATPVADPKAVEMAERRGYDQAVKKMKVGFAREAQTQIMTVYENLRSVVAPLSIHLDEEIKKARKASVEVAVEYTAISPAPRPAPNAPPRSLLQAKPAAPKGNGDASEDDRPLGAERKPLAALASVYPAGMTEAQWAVSSGLKRTGGTWSAYISRLKMAGRFAQQGDLYFITEKGLADLGEAPTPLPPPGRELVEFWAGKITGVGPMIRRLAEVYPEYLTKDQLAGDLNMAASGGTFGAYLSRLRSPGLIEEDREKNIRAAPQLMEGAS